MFTVFGSPDPTIEDEPRRLQFFLVATREDVQTTINQLQVLRFCERIHWSPPIPVLGSDWQYIMMQRDR